MTFDREALRVKINAQYQQEHHDLGEAGTYRMLDEARQWDLAGTLSGGGVIQDTASSAVLCAV